MPKQGKSYQTWLSERLTDPQKAADYINAAIEEGSQEMLLLALRDVAEAHRMSKVAKGAGVARETIYRILCEKGNPRLSSLWGLFPTLGLEFRVRPRIKTSPKTKSLERRNTAKVHDVSTKGQHTTARRRFSSM